MARTHAIAVILVAAASACAAAGEPGGGVPGRAFRTDAESQELPLVTGKAITPLGKHTFVGSFPANMLITPDGRFVVVTNTGFRQALSVLDGRDGRLISQIAVNDTRNGKKQGLYWGIAFAPNTNGRMLWASRGAEDRLVAYRIAEDGAISEAGTDLADPPKDPRWPNLPAGVAVSADGAAVYAAANNTSRSTDLKGALTIWNAADGKVRARVPLPGFSFGVAAITTGPNADRKVYVSSERDGVVSVVDPQAARWVQDVRTGASPTALLLDRAQQRLFVSNSGSDTISILDTRTDRVVRTVLLRPDGARGLPGATPLGLALSPDEKRLYVALADMNAVAVLSLPDARLRGYLPVGWYPTSLVVSADGRRLLVANAKGVAVRNPNGRDVGKNGRYIENIIDGCISTIPTPSDADLARHTRQVIANNRLPATPSDAARALLPHTGIQHIIYVIKENRTYDQVLGDLPQGNGDPTLCLFPRSVTPNQHALAERFVLLDNWYCCAEVSADGWNWSTSGMANEYVARNAPYNYSGRGRVYDYEGQNNDVPVDIEGYNDVARAPGGYIWDLCIRHGVSVRNYGFFVDFDETPPRGKEGLVQKTARVVPNKKPLANRTDLDFRLFDMDYADSDAWALHGVTFKGHRKEFGAHRSTSRFQEWKREFDAFVKAGRMPAFSMVRFCNDHTAGTSTDKPTPRAYVADNDYAVGQLVDAVSHSPFWKSTAIFLVEDDAQNGNDHVDAHRSTAYVISPYVPRGTVDSRFYNTDSTLRTMELLLGLPPMCQYDAVAPPIDCFVDQPVNAEPYSAILPTRDVLAEVNTKTAYKASVSDHLNFKDPDAAPDDLLTDIIWHAVRGKDVAMPPVRRGLSAAPRPSRLR